MGRRGMMGMAVMILGFVLMVPSLVWAADGDAAASPTELTDATRAEILQTIEATRETDPELAAVMEEQLRQVESGEVPLHELVGPETDRGLALGAPDVAGRGGLPADAPGLIGPPIAGGTAGGNYLPPELGSGSFATGQVSITTSATQIVAARAGRRAVLVVQHGTTVVSVGASGVTTSTGVRLPGTDGAALVVATSAALFGIVASGTQTVSFIELFD